MSCGTKVFFAGPSASGKTTLAKALSRSLGIPYFSLDEYFIPKPREFVEMEDGRMVRTFERPRLYDAQRLVEDLLRCHGGAVAEGFCLFTYPEVRALPAAFFYLDVTFAVCAARRAARRPQRRSDASFLPLSGNRRTRPSWNHRRTSIPS